MTNDAELKSEILRLAEKEFDFSNKEIVSIEAIERNDNRIYRVVVSLFDSGEELERQIKDGATTEPDKQRFLEEGMEVTAIYDGRSFSEMKWRGIDYF